MQVNIMKLNGNWDLGYSLDKHIISSVPIGENQFGHMMFDTQRTEIGESLFQLKYRNDYNQIKIIAEQMFLSLPSLFPHIDLVIPMPPSTLRSKQPVTEIAKEFSKLINKTFENNLLTKNSTTIPMKDITNRDEKVETLMNSFGFNDILTKSSQNVLIIDDLFDTGSSLEAATNVLKEYSKILNVYVATVTRKRDG